MKNKRGRILVIIGLLLIAVALLLTGYNFSESVSAERSSALAVSNLESIVTEKSSKDARMEVELSDACETKIPDYILNPEMNMPVEQIDGRDYIGLLRIPTLGLELPIISEWSYPALREAPCRYLGSVYLNNMILAGHNYASHFGNLTNLREGDIVSFTDVDGNTFHYSMVEMETLQSTDVEEMENGDWDLTLFTCTVGGKSRVTVRFKSIEK